MHQITHKDCDVKGRREAHLWVLYLISMLRHEVS